MTEPSRKYFISYAHADAGPVLDLAKRLRGVNANVWMDTLDILAGERWDASIQAALETCQGVVVILSPRWIASLNCSNEVLFAQNAGKRIIPVVLESCRIPYNLTCLHCIDYAADRERGFEDLSKALAHEPPPGNSAAGAPAEPVPPGAEARVADEPEPPVEESAQDQDEPRRSIISDRLHAWLVRIVVLIAVGIIGYLIVSIVLHGAVKG